MWIVIAPQTEASEALDAPSLGQVGAQIGFLTPVRVPPSRVDVAGGTDPVDIAGCDDIDPLPHDDDDDAELDEVREAPRRRARRQRGSWSRARTYSEMT